MPISVVINTYNAEQRLRQVLDSVKDFDEIVICDMESTDSTLSIAHEFNCKIVTFPKNGINICEPARNTAIQSASNKWVLVIDADEVVTPQLRDYLYRLTTDANHPDGLYLPRMNHMFGLFVKSSYPDYQLRFFLKDTVDWPPVIHSTPHVEGRVDRIPKERQELALIHLADDPETKYIAKLNTYSDNEAVRRAGKKVTLAKLIFHPFFRFFKSYFMKGGFRLGKYGFIMACNDAIYKFLVLTKMVENADRNKQL